MSHHGLTYVIFDGDEDKWAYAYMLGWNKNPNIQFNFQNAHDLDNMTSRAQGEAYVKARLRERMKKSSYVLVVVGEKTKNLYKFVRWELELALELGLPIVVANLNGNRRLDAERCPPILKGRCAMHVPFKMAAIKYALDNWPGQFRSLTALGKGDWYYYKDHVYQNLGL